VIGGIVIDAQKSFKADLIDKTALVLHDTLSKMPIEQWLLSILLDNVLC
jgi:hypothetical protein